MELWDIYDMEGKRTGGQMASDDPIGPGQYHLVVHVCIFNSAGKMLIQHRQLTKERWPDLWDITVGGRACAEESSQMAITRELKEELGIEASFEGIRPALRLSFEKGFDDIYLLEKELDPAKLLLQPEEVQSVRWADEQEIIDLIRSERFIPYQEHYIQLLFAIRGQEGYIRRT